MSELRERLRNEPMPGEAEAAARSWPVVEAALAEREPSAGPRGGGAHRRRAALRLALVAALIGAALATALSPAGAAVGDWIGDRFTSTDKRAAPAFAGLPEGGSVLALTGTGAYAIRPDGGSRRLGSFSDAGWSPRGLHVVGVDGRRLIAVTPRGTVKWTLARRHRLHNPAWSRGLGFAVAYLEGATLRVVDGKGNPDTDRPLRRRVAPVTPAWRPHSDRVLAYATGRGGIETIDVDTGRALWRAAGERVAFGPPRALAWSRSGRRLVALSSRKVTVFDASGRVLHTIDLPGSARELALHPSGERAVVVVGTRVLGLRLSRAGAPPAQLFQGDVDGIAWSRDGRHLLLGWRGAGEWLVLGPGARIRPLHDVSRELGTADGFPRVAGWCCAD